MQPALTWGGNYSRFTFDEVKRYFYMLKEQGVPVLDDEFNLSQEIALTLMRRLVLDVLGDGAINDGFKIVGTGAANDFAILGGDGTADGAGHFYVGGYLVVIASDSTYAGQELAAPALTTPSAARVDEVYLDVYLDEVDSVDDPNIIDPVIGIETSRRLKLYWQVLVAEGGAVPAAYTDVDNRQHFTAHLATINRTATAAINADMLTDRRRSVVLARSDDFTAHTTDGGAHGATSAATASAIIRRDAYGRAKVTAPSDPDDIARKADVDAAQAAAVFPATTVMLFCQSTAPTGWTKLTDQDDAALRVVSGSVGSGGATAFSSVFVGNRSVSSTSTSGNVGTTTLSTGQMPAHSHTLSENRVHNASGGGSLIRGSESNILVRTLTLSTEGQSLSHGHTFTGVSHDHTLDMSVKYVDVIRAQKD